MGGWNHLVVHLCDAIACASLAIRGHFEVGIRNADWQISGYTLYTRVYPGLHHWLQVNFYIKCGRKDLFLSSVMDFDRGLLENYTVKVLYIVHVRSLRSTKSSGIWIMDYLWIISFLLHVKVGWSLILSSVKDFDRGLLEKYTVKVLYIMHAGSLGSTKFSSIWILD